MDDTTLMMFALSLMLNASFALQAITGVKWYNAFGLLYISIASYGMIMDGL